MTKLKLVALDGEDLEILSAHLQDAVLRVGDMAYLPKEKRFAAIANRFDWEKAQIAEKNGGKSYERRRAALRFDRVLGAKVKDIALAAPNTVLELLALQFEASDAPEGYINLYFAGGGTIRLHVECIEAELSDLGAAWSAKSKPDHVEEDLEGQEGA